MTAQTIDRDGQTEATSTFDRGLGWLLAIGGVIGSVSACILIIEKIHLLENPQGALSCDINPIVGCGLVINTDQAAAFGFPNVVLGIAGFAVVAAMGILTIGGVRLPKWVWMVLQVGGLFGVCFVTWLQYESIYVIHGLCPYCMVVWTVTIAIFVWLTARNLRTYAPDHPVSRVVGDWTLLINILWYVAIISAIWFQFGSDLWA